MPLQLIKHRCPHCRRDVAVDDAEIGTEIRCPYGDCQQPIYVEPRDSTEAVDSERTLATIHPVMFRTDPLIAVGLWGALVGGIVILIRWGMGGLNGWMNETAVLVFGLVLAVGAGLGLLSWWLIHLCTSLQITTERSLMKRGVLSRQTSEVRHRDVRNLQVHQNIYHRLVGIGHLSISSAGQEDMEISMRGMPNPHAIAELIREQQE